MKYIIRKHSTRVAFPFSSCTRTCNKLNCALYLSRDMNYHPCLDPPFKPHFRIQNFIPIHYALADPTKLL